MTEHIERALGRIEQKIDGLVVSHSETKHSLSDLSKRTQRLERRENYLLGLVAGGGAVAGMVLTLVFHIAKALGH